MRVLLVAVIAASLMGACTQSRTGPTDALDPIAATGPDPSRAEILYGTVTDARTVEIQGRSAGFFSKSGRFAAFSAGAILLGPLGAALGVVGAVVGSLVDQAVTSRSGVEVTVDLDDGPSISVVQVTKPDAPPLVIGTPVAVVFAEGVATVVPVPEDASVTLAAEDEPWIDPDEATPQPDGE